MGAEPRSQSSKLYTPRLLSLSAELANFPLTGEFAHSSEMRSRTCGSSLILGFDTDAHDRVSRIGIQATACAVGQSSAAIMAHAAEGKGAGEFAAVLEQIERWLAGDLSEEGELPDWPGFDALAPARAHSGRHGALLLPWKAMHAALSSAAS